jgi:hypothetical protein
MENHTAAGGTIFSIISAVLLWLSLQQTQIILAIIVSCIGGVAGIFSARYYWIAFKEKKESIKKLKSNQ